MPSDEKNILIENFKPLFKQRGFKKKGATWHRHINGFIQVFNIQGSQWSKSFYFNLGIYIKALGDDQAPPEYKCHIRNRLADLLDDCTSYLNLVDFKNDVRPEQRFPELIEIVEKNAFPWLDNYCNLEKIKDWILGAQPHGLPVSKAVFQYLGIKKE